MVNKKNRQKKGSQPGEAPPTTGAQTPQPGTSQPRSEPRPDQHQQQQGAGASRQPHQQPRNVPQQPASSQPRQSNPNVPQQQQQQDARAWRQPNQQARNAAQQPASSLPRQQQDARAWRQPNQQARNAAQQPASSQPRQPNPQQQTGASAWSQPRQQPPSAQPSQSNPGVSQQRPQSQPPQQQPAATETPRSQPGTLQQKQQTAEKVADIQDQLAKTTIKDSSLTTGPAQVSKIPKDLTRKDFLKIPKRKEAGTLGLPIKVETNMLPIKFGKKFPSKVIHYDVKIDPSVPKYLMRPAFDAAKDKLFGRARNPAFDGKQNAFSAGALFDGEEMDTEVVVNNEDGKEKKFTVAFKKVNVLDLSWVRTENPFIEERNQTCIQALDVILRNAAAVNSRAIVGRSFFTPPRRPESLGGGMDLWTGLFQSAVCGWGPLLNIDVAHKGFPKPQSVIDLMKTLCGVDDGDNGGGDARGQGFGRGRGGYNRGGPRGGGRGGYQDRGQSRPTELTPDLIHQYKDDISSYLKGLKILYQLPNQPTSRRTWRVRDLVKSPVEDIFSYRDPNTEREQNISIDFYYKHVKKYFIQNPHFPCLSVGPKGDVHLPVELCSIIGGQATQKKLNETQTSKMIRFAATGTEDRKRKIMDAFAAMRHKEDPCMKEFDLALGEQFEKVPARVLPTPTLVYQQNKGVSVSKGVWRADRLQFHSPCDLLKNPGSWTILNLDNRTDDGNLHDLKFKLQSQARNFGIIMGEPETPFQSFRANLNELNKYFNEKKNRSLQLIIVIIPDMKGPYSKVKQTSELKIGILTQCIKGKTLKKINTDPTVVANILLKINAKLNGTNHTLAGGEEDKPACLNTRFMIVGADVTHPSPDATDIPSIAAVTASHDRNAFKYRAEIRLQPARKEIILDLKEIMIIHLNFFQSINKFLPGKIIFFRDGVGEGQFNEVMSTEVNDIRNACKHINKDYRPDITFLVVQKRHHVRLFPTSPENSDDWHKNKNVKAGTIVDTHITNPAYTNFYLVSHASIQGTARPTKYCCLWDDSNFSENDIEKLTYFLCHMYTRCNRSVSYPAPTYYAHLAAFRARALTQDVQINMKKLDDPIGRIEEQRKILTINDDVLKKKPMFFV